MRKGSSSSASCSAISPVSLHRENSEPAESEDSDDRRLPCFSLISLVDSSSEVVCSMEGRDVEVRVRRGMLAGWLREVEGGMLAVMLG
jgi:hypothetical protein